MKILILAALPSELDGARAPDGAQVIFTGLGKVKAAIATAEAVNDARPDLVINFGTAGKINKALHGLVEVGSVIQRDMSTEPIAPRGVTPFSADPPILHSGHGEAVCGTGDSFVTAIDPWLVEQGVDVVDMELFAIAYACVRHGVPWRAFKYITDEAGDAAADEWHENVAGGEALFWQALRGL